MTGAGMAAPVVICSARRITGFADLDQGNASTIRRAWWLAVEG